MGWRGREGRQVGTQCGLTPHWQVYAPKKKKGKDPANNSRTKKSTQAKQTAVCCPYLPPFLSVLYSTVTTIKRNEWKNSYVQQSKYIVLYINKYIYIACIYKEGKEHFSVRWQEYENKSGCAIWRQQAALDSWVRERANEEERGRGRESARANVGKIK